MALEGAFGDRRKQVMGVDRESKLTFGFSDHGTGVDSAGTNGFLLQVAECYGIAYGMLNVWRT